MFVWTAEKPVKSFWSDQMIHHGATPARAIVSKNSFLLTHPCPAPLRTACPVWETPPAAGHLPARPVAQGPAVAVEKIWARRKKATQSKDRMTIHGLIEYERRHVSYMSENETDQPTSNLRRQPSANYIEMATRMDKRRIVKDPDGYGKRTGACGDTVEMFLVVRHNRIHEVFFVTDGCINTHACANAVSFLVQGKTIAQARKITPEKVIRFLETLPTENTHCAELAVGALYLAMANFREFKQAPWKRIYDRRT